MILLIGCSVPPDDYLGIVDTTTWDARFGGTTSSVAPLCVVPQTAVKNDSSATWYYAGNFSLRLLDPLNTQDPTRPLPTEFYRISGCAPDSSDPFDFRTDNFVKDRQYPVYAQNAAEPLNALTYNPFYFVTPVNVRDQRVGCNDVRGERTLLDRGGWDRDAPAANLGRTVLRGDHVQSL